MLTKKQAEFINAARSRNADLGRQRLETPFVAKIRKADWVVATDGKRLHAVRLPSGAEIPLGWVHVSDFGDVHAIAGKNDPIPSIVKAVWPTDRVRNLIEREQINVLAAAKDSGLAVAFGGDGAARPHATWQPKATGDVIVNPRYIGDAIAHIQPVRHAPECVDYVDGIYIERPGEDGSEAVVVTLGDPEDPMTIEDSADSPSWRAVIMPVRL